MKYRFIGTQRVHIGALGIVEPGQEFEVENEYMIETIFNSKIFEIVKKEVKIKKDGD
jgi:hypothetical protein